MFEKIVVSIIVQYVSVFAEYHDFVVVVAAAVVVLLLLMDAPRLVIFYRVTAV